MASVFQPFVRQFAFQQDSCPSTNKSQFAFGSFALLLALGVFDVVRYFFMVVGHTKFGPDRLARGIAEPYSKNYTYNLAHLNEHVESAAATAVPYDGRDVLRTAKIASSKMFKPVDKIMSSREFILLADDGKVNLGEGVAKASCEAASHFPNKGLLYGDDVIEREAALLAERSLGEVFDKVHGNSFQGVGSGTCVCLSFLPYIVSLWCSILSPCHTLYHHTYTLSLSLSY